MKKNNLIEKILSLYADAGWKKWFSKIRFWDAPYLEVERIVPKKGFIVDIGCGEGVFTNFLGISSSKRMLLGIELDKQRFSQADHGIKNVSFKHGDATKFKIPKCNAVILFHLLHHLRSKKDQEKVIANATKALTKNGKLIIVEVDIKPTLKYLTAWVTDHFVVPIFFEKKLYEPHIYFRKKKEWLNLFGHYGLKCKIIKAEDNKPFSHIIYSCIKN